MSNNGWAPEGSSSNVNPDGSISITPPPGWSYAGYEEETGDLYIVSGGGAGATVSCKCNTTGGCSPFTASGPKGSTQGCAGDCTNCTMTQSVAATDFGSGGYFNLNQAAEFVAVGNDLPAAFEALYDVPDVQTIITNFLDSIYQGAPLPELTEGPGYVLTPSGYSFAGVNIAGRFVLLPFPDAAIPAATVSGGKASCSCTQGTCTLHSAGLGPLGGATWCEGNCTGTCSLTTSVAAGGGGWNVVDQNEVYQY